MNMVSQRRAYTSLMTLLATSFAVIVFGERYARQADVFTDKLKIGFLIAVSTALVGFVIWSFMSSRFAPFKTRPFLRGAIAGALTALIIIPLPAFVWSLKTELLSAYQSGSTELFKMAIQSLISSIGWGLLTFITITKASLIAIIGSACVGAGVVHYFPMKRSVPAQV